MFLRCIDTLSIGTQRGTNEAIPPRFEPRARKDLAEVQSLGSTLMSERMWRYQAKFKLEDEARIAKEIMRRRLP